MYVSKIKDIELDLGELVSSYQELITKVPWGDHRHWNLTYIPGNTDKTFSDSHTYYEPAGEGLVYSENHATLLNPTISGTYYETVLDTVKQYFPICRVKFTRIPAGFIYPVHQDLYNHIHIPILGESSGAMFDCYNTNTVHWMPADGNAYLCRTKKVPHTFFNADHARSNTWRVNLICVVNMTPEELQNEPTVV